MKSALNSMPIQILAAVILLVCAAAMTGQCARQLAPTHGTMLSTVPGTVH